MDLNDKKISTFEKFIKSFGYASEGIKLVVKNEFNMRFHIAMTIIVLVLAILLSIPTLQLIILLMLIGIVLALEMINTAIERTVDLVTEDYHPLAKQAKDAAAGAVLVFSIMTVVIGILIFFQPLLTIIVRQ
jgi:undecaprenol kinase